MDDVDSAVLFRAAMREYLLDALYRLERLEEIHGISSERLNGMSSDRLPPLETDAEQSEAMALLEQRLTRIETVLGE